MSLDHWLFSHLLFSKSLLILNHCQTSIIMRLLQPCHCAVTLQTHHELHSSGCLISKIWWSKCGLYPNSIPGCRPIWGYLCYTLRSTPSVSLLIHLSPSVTTDKKGSKLRSNSMILVKNKAHLYLSDHSRSFVKRRHDLLKLSSGKWTVLANLSQTARK